MTNMQSKGDVLPPLRPASTKRRRFFMGLAIGGSVLVLPWLPACRMYVTDALRERVLGIELIAGIVCLCVEH